MLEYSGAESSGPWGDGKLITSINGL